MKTKRILTLTFLLLIIFQTLSYASSDSTANDAGFIDYEITNFHYDGASARTIGLVVKEFGLGKTSDGRLSVQYDTFCTGVASEIGVENLCLQRKTWYGAWENIRVTNPVSYNSEFNVGGYYWLNPSPGTYRLIGTHYAILNGIRYEEFHIGGDFVF